MAPHPPGEDSARLRQRVSLWKIVGHLGWGAWFILVLFLIQNAVASRLENEPRAALLYWMLVFALVLGGGIVYLSRKTRLE